MTGFPGLFQIYVYHAYGLEAGPFRQMWTQIWIQAIKFLFATWGISADANCNQFYITDHVVCP